MTFLPTHALLRSALLGGGLGLFAVVLLQLAVGV